MKTNQKITTLWVVLHIPFIAIFLFATWFFFSPFTAIKIFADSLTPDKNLEVFTLSLYQTLLPNIITLGVISLIGISLSLLFPQKSRKLLRNTLDFLNALHKTLKKDAQLFWASTKKSFSREENWGLLLAMMVIGAILRSMLINRPMSHDESYTYITFILPGLANIVSDYHLPNNHILYTIFAYFSVHLFGNSPWSLKLPALIAGIFLIPASYLAARQYFNRLVGLLVSGIVTTFPVFLLYSTSARGYAQLVLLCTLLWFFASLLLKKKNLFIWLLFVFTAAAGFYTIPIMLYPYTATLAWLFFAWAFNEYSSEYKKSEFLKYLFFSGIAVVFFFGLLYLPVFMKTGVSSAFYSDIMQPTQEINFELFQDSLLSRSIRSWKEWHQHTASITPLLSLSAVILSFLGHRTLAKKRINYFLTSLLVIILMVTFQQTVGWMRVWFFFAPIYFSFAAAGLIYLLQNMFKLKEKIILGIITVMVIFSLGYTTIWLKNDSPEMRELRGEPCSLEVAVQYLSEIITEEDAIVTNSSDTPTMQYYTDYYKIPLSHSYPADNRFTSIYTILLSPEDTVEGTLHKGTWDRVSLEETELIYSKGDLRIYKIPIVIFYED